MRDSKFFSILAAAFVILLLGSCRSQLQSTEGMHSATLRLKWVYDPGFAGEMVAAKGGYFHAAGVDVSLRPGGFESDPIKLVASGSDTFGVSGADSFLLARAKGVPIIAFAGGYLETPVVFYVHGNSSIRSPRDFQGRRVGYQAGQDTATVYEALIRKMNIDRSKIKEVPIRYDFTPFLANQLDVWPGYAATQSYILERQGVPYKVIVPSEYGISYLGTVYFCSEKFLAEHAVVVQAFVDGLIRGWEFTYANYDTAIPMIASYDRQNLTPDLIRFNLNKQRASVLPAGSRFCQFTDDAWKRLQETLLAEGLLAKPVDLTRARDNRFLDKHYGTTTTKQ